LVASKGLFFVHLYGAFEFTVISAVMKTIEYINANGHYVNECKPVLMSLALSPCCDALFSATDKKWEKRWELFSHFERNSRVDIPDALIPTNGRNIKVRQLQGIWTSFCLKDPVLPRPEIGGRIQELVDNRNAIAHGDASAADIGSLNSISDLYKKYNDISELCSYIVDTLDAFVRTKGYLK